ncbi:hypothetical protein N7499_009347 [Penicillium canescens]|uniref:Uncharacterized protein n=1 Tax=Penicillium canescens TaxID=5083 RepID=A0AAD6NER8_PENCN|nr:uncharacterized protein N7446_008627 [Penicillium canescens]KAJ6019687.1 hypothetical protein N7522_001754 [Penicillium canescens]KAJ6033077.1 hypothetical protein N7444_010848 [Penicillium canescens]KAJ6057731.1 hypothetical protein N7460_001005 [Penicillium canescens]KAJ6059044.1 hypothetical protein N7446_008627 [Penicillium canescens]KAJ6071333.1 hypothetical protein N7499_009347 [Penicillium canescens]
MNAISPLTTPLARYPRNPGHRKSKDCYGSQELNVGRVNVISKPTLADLSEYAFPGWIYVGAPTVPPLQALMANPILVLYSSRARIRRSGTR